MLHLSVLAEPGQTSNKLFKLLSLPCFIRIEDQMIYPTWSLRRIIVHEWKNCFLNSNRTLANIALTLYGTWINGMQRCDIILKLSVNNHFFLPFQKLSGPLSMKDVSIKKSKAGDLRFWINEHYIFICIQICLEPWTLENFAIKTLMYSDVMFPISSVKKHLFWPFRNLTRVMINEKSFYQKNTRILEYNVVPNFVW